MFLIKTADEIFVEMFHLFKFVNAIYGERPTKSLVCDVSPSGSFRQSQTENQNTTYPEYCNDLAYMMTPDLASQFLKAASKVPQTAPEEMYITGFLREYLNIKPFYLNLRYTYDEQTYLRWLLGRMTLPLPYLFAKVSPETSVKMSVESDSVKIDRMLNWIDVVKELWNKTLRIHNGN